MGSFNGDMISSWSTETAETPIVGGRYTTRAEEPQKVLSLVELKSLPGGVVVVEHLGMHLLTVLQGNHLLYTNGEGLDRLQM